MKIIVATCWLFALMASCTAHAQKAKHYNLAHMLANGEIITNPRSQATVLNNTYPGAISAVNSIWFKKLSFGDGTIDIDLRGKDVFLQSFLGIIFHQKDTANYDVLYFRPFNFKHGDTLRRKWSVQYMSLPDYDYDVLRKNHPLVYENSVTPVPNPDDWFHATIIVKDGKLSVYVNHSTIASLQVTLLNGQKEGALGLFSDGLESDFANLVITK